MKCYSTEDQQRIISLVYKIQALDELNTRTQKRHGNVILFLCFIAFITAGIEGPWALLVLFALGAALTHSYVDERHSQKTSFGLQDELRDKYDVSYSFGKFVGLNSLNIVVRIDKLNEYLSQTRRLHPAPYS